MWGDRNGLLVTIEESAAEEYREMYDGEERKLVWPENNQRHQLMVHYRPLFVALEEDIQEIRGIFYGKEETDSPAKRYPAYHPCSKRHEMNMALISKHEDSPKDDTLYIWCSNCHISLIRMVFNSKYKIGEPFSNPPKFEWSRGIIEALQGHSHGIEVYVQPDEGTKSEISGLIGRLGANISMQYAKKN